jgi:PAS domain S-box-containing protein
MNSLDIQTNIISKLKTHMLWNVIDQSVHSVVITDVNGHILYVNDYFTKLTGYTLDDIMGQNPRILNSGIQPKDYYDELWATILSGEVWLGQFCNKKKTGEYYWEDATIYPITDDNQIYFIAIKKDITEQVTAQKKLQETQTTLRNMIDAVAESLLMVDPTGKILVANETYANQFGMTSETIKGKMLDNHLPQEIFESHMKNVKKVSETCQHVIEIDEQFLENRYYPIPNDDNLVDQIVIFSRDTAHLVDAKRKLKTSKQRFRRAIESAPVPIMLHAEDGEVVMINQIWTDITGYQHDQIPTTADWAKRAYGKRVEIVKKLISNLYPTKTVIHAGPYEVTTESGNKVTWDFHFAPLGEMADGRQLRMTMAVDITENLKLQAQATQAQILEAELKKERELSELKERLMSTISHEFRTPLTIIQTSVDLLNLYFDRLDEDKRKTHLNRISEQIKYTVKLLDQTMQLRHVQSGRIEFIPAQLDIKMFCMMIFDKMKFADNNKHIMQFICDADSIEIYADASLIEHIVQNLLSNAIKYTPDGKSITMLIKQNVDAIIIQIADEGIGTPPQDIKRLFDPYHRASNVGNIQGTGLGLAIVKEYVELHGGSITCKSGVNIGSQFIIQLPYNAITPAEKSNEEGVCPPR